MTGKIIDITVDTLGARGDGIADTPAGRLYVPFAAPGDRLRVRLGAARGEGRAAHIVGIAAPSPDRIEPTCLHFGNCGGCALQHVAAPAVAAIKRDLVTAALGRRGLADAPVADTITIEPGSRRRVEFAWRRQHAPILGFNERASSRVLNVMQCPVTDRMLVDLLEPLRSLCATVDALGAKASLQLTRTESGVDLLLRPARPRDPDLAARQALADFATEQNLCRVSWQGPDGIEPIAARRPALVRFAGTDVNLPPGAFLQPSAEGEAAIVGLVEAALAADPPKRIADLYAGCGTLTFPLARIAPVDAIEGDAGMVAALRDAAREQPIAVAARDLMRDPLSPEALGAFDAVVFDPPRAGARPLAEALALSTVPRIVAVSCNPATLARDLRLLVDGGYSIERVTPIDQFAWSPHVEAVAVLHR